MPSSGNAHTADGAFEFALPALRRAKRWAREVWLCADAGFPAGHDVPTAPPRRCSS